MASVARYFNMDKTVMDFAGKHEKCNAVMYFGINDSTEFANKCGMRLLEEKTFFPDVLKMLGNRLGFVTKVSMKIAEKKNKC